MKAVTPYSVAFLIAGLSLYLTHVPSALTQSFTQVQDWSTYDVILYDAETIARINTPAQFRTYTPGTASTNANRTIVNPIITPESTGTQTAALPATNLPPTATTNIAPQAPALSDAQSKIEALVTYRNHKDIPVIVSAPDCADTDLAIRMTITDFKKTGGHVVVDLHNDNPEEWLKSRKVVLRVRQPVTAKSVNICMPMASTGQYAIGAYHDRNDNMDFDKNFLGIPKERFGASKNPKFGLSKPDLSESIFTVSSTGADISIKLLSAGDIL